MSELTASKGLWARCRDKISRVSYKQDDIAQFLEKYETARGINDPVDRALALHVLKSQKMDNFFTPTGAVAHSLGSFEGCLTVIPWGVLGLFAMGAPLALAVAGGIAVIGVSTVVHLFAPASLRLAGAVGKDIAEAVKAVDGYAIEDISHSPRLDEFLQAFPAIKPRLAQQVAEDKARTSPQMKEMLANFPDLAAHFSQVALIDGIRNYGKAQTAEQQQGRPLITKRMGS